MGLTDVIQRMWNSTTRFTKNALVTSTILAGSLFAQQAYAQDTKQKEEAEVSISDDQETVEQKLKLIYGKVQADAEGTPSRNTFHGSAELKFGIGDFRPVVYAEARKDVFDQDPEDLEYTGGELGLGLGLFVVKNDKTEWYIEPIVSFGTGKYENAIDLDIDTVGIGVKAGVADKKNGTKFIVTYMKRFGDYDGELLSGFKLDGKVDMQYVAADFTHRISGKGKKSAGEMSELDKLVQGAEFAESVYFLAGAYWKDDKFKDFLTEDGYGVRLGIEYVRNWKENGKGSTLRITPQILIEKISAENEIASRKVDATRIRPHVYSELEIGSGWVVSNRIGFEFFEREIKATAGNTNEDKDGLYWLISLGKRF